MCPICKVPYYKGDDSHAHNGPIMGTCYACFIFATEMRLWIVRSGGRELMGDWTTQWMREILSNPGKYRT